MDFLKKSQQKTGSQKENNRKQQKITENNRKQKGKKHKKAFLFSFLSVI